MQANRAFLIPPAYAGAALHLAWTYLTFYANTAGIEAAAPVSLMSAAYSLSAVVMVATLFIIAFSKGIGSAQLTSIPVKIITPFGLSVGTLLLVTNGFDYQNDFTPLVVAGALLTGVFSGILVQQWVLVYSRIGLRTAVCSFPALMAVALGVSILLMYLPQPVMFAGMVALPIVSEAMLHAARHSITPYCDIDEHTSDKPINFALLLLPMVVFSFASGFLDFFSDRSAYTFVFYALMGFIPLVLAGVFIILTNREYLVPTLLVPVFFLVALFVPFFTLYSDTFTAQFISIGELAAEVVLLLCTIGFAGFFSLSPFKTYALSRAVYVLLSSIGWYAAEFTSSSLDALGSSLASLTIVFVSIEVVSVVLIVAIVKTQKAELVEAERSDALTADGSEGEGFAALEAGLPSVGKGASATSANLPSTTSDAVSASAQDDGRSSPAGVSHAFAASCLALGERFGLSKREIDVLGLLARGFSSARIQSELYIAAGTVNYHTRNIYAKLGVHSKQEVIDLVANELKGRSSNAPADRR
ncbi:MAG: LuxR C-terminal-related transcriptional regulator [Eggerthellaceae bacterium]|nr:LuxR C-terminal-related transcriptional regulator [Eggerthellaceae bacterium]